MTILRIGTAGWSVPSRYAAAFARAGTHVERYARVLNAAEINSSFHRPHRRKTYEKWAASVPPDFRFSVKVPKTITHEHALKDCEAEMARFLAEASGLGEKLEVLLLQLPPKSAFDSDIVETFFQMLQRQTLVRVAIEPRHASWFTADVDRWLAAQKITRVAADPAKIGGAAEPGGDNALVYYRWHGSPRTYYSDYNAGALAALRNRFAAHRASAQVWCIFDNTASGAALGNALTLSRTD